MTFAAGFQGCPPSLTCDQCRLVLTIRTGRRGGPPEWLLGRGAPKGWRVEGTLVEGRRHYCPECRQRRTDLSKRQQLR